VSRLNGWCFLSERVAKLFGIFVGVMKLDTLHLFGRHLATPSNLEPAWTITKRKRRPEGRRFKWK
jgi:hypothetical protein